MSDQAKISYPRHWWFSCSMFTCYVATDDQDLIMPQSAPIVRKRFTGRHVKKLVGWMKDIGGFMYAEYDGNNRKL